MRKIFIILFLMLSVFSITSANTFKNEKELNNFFIQVDKIVKEELKKDYKNKYLKRKNLPNNEYTIKIEDDKSFLISKKTDLKPETVITQYFNNQGELHLISSLTSITDGELCALYRKYDLEGNLVINTYGIEGKNTDKGYYSNGKLAYIKEFKILKGKAPIQVGKYIEYYKNGNIKVQGNYKEGKRDGEFKVFLRNGKSAGSIFYKDGKIIKSTLVNSMKDNASFSLVTDINYNSNSHEIVTYELPNQLLKQYFIFNKNGLLDGESREYYEEGDIKSVSLFKNNVADGIFISYYQNGNIKEKHTYKNGNEEGEGLFYYENAKLEEKYFMKNGKLEGESTAYFEDGKIRNKSIFKDGVKLEEETYKDDEIRKNTFKNGEIVQQDIYSKNKKLKAKKFFLGNGKTKIISYYENGNKQEEVFVINELFDGEAFTYYPSGKIENKSFFKNGKREGESLTYYENGKLKKKILYKNGMRNGFAIAYYENGIIEQKAYFVDDKKENERLYYDKKGNLIKTEIYKNDVKQ